MFKKTMLLAMVLLLVMASSALAQEYPAVKSDRPLVLTKGTARVGGEFGLGLDSGREAKDMTLNLGFAYGIIENLELGVDVQPVNYTDGVDDFKFGGAAIFARYAFLEWLGVYFDVHVPGFPAYGANASRITSFGDQLLGVRPGLEAQYTLIENHLQMYGGVFADLGFASESLAGQSLQLALIVEYGIVANVMKELWFDLNVQAQMQFRPDTGGLGDRTALPVALRIGSTPIDILDVWAGFVMTDLNDSADSRAAVLGAAYHF